jgi:light-regulated signal transduction histidine kinase (bacteriophytochrome)
VVDELTKVARKTTKKDKSNVSVKENIEAVLSIYKYQLENTRIDIKISNDLTVTGSDITLFQLWKHIILYCCKNYQSFDTDDFLEIEAKTKNKCVEILFHIHGISNNKEEINEIDKIQSIRDKLNPNINFKLGIIKKIVTDHKGQLKIDSSEKNTVFKIILPI